MALFYHPDLLESKNVLPEEESRHAVRILRLKSGDVINITNGKGILIEAVIAEANSEALTFTITNEIENKTPQYSIHLAIAPTKQRERMEWMVEKTVEIGVQQITFFQSQNSERTKINVARLQKIAIAAMKQSMRSWLPVISSDVNFQTIVKTNSAQKFIAFVDDSNPHHLKNKVLPKTSYIILVGPEGDFTQKELSLAIDCGFEKVSLGPHRLRTETAGLAACHIVNLVNQ